MGICSRARSTIYGRMFSGMIDSIRRAFAEFLYLPTAIIVGFLLLAAGTHLLDLSTAGWLAPGRAFLHRHLFADLTATRGLLGTIGSGMITVTSITFSLLLLAVQQSAASLTNEVFDQFLRRRLNQIYFGFFVGLALYALTILATVHSGFNPVYGATLTLLLTIVALYLLIVLIHSTINQMRPSEIIAAIHDRTLASRECQLGLIRSTRRVARHGDGGVPVTAATDGFVTRIRIETIAAAIDATGTDAGEVEIILLVSIGSFVAFRDTLATIATPRPEDAEPLCRAVRDAIHLERQRDLDTDPAYGVEQLATIGWTSISSAKSNPAPGILTIRRLRDILARWSEQQDTPDARPLPLVYTDTALPELMDAFDSLAVICSESMQHQSLAEIVRAFALLFERLSPEQQGQVERIVLRMLSTLGDHVLTRDLDDALSALTGTLRRCGRGPVADAISAAQTALAASMGALNSRSTRVPGG